MGIFKWKKKAEATVPNLMGNYTSSPLVWNRADALSNSALWACITMLASQYATLPIYAYKKGTREALPEGRLMTQLLERPNPYMTHYDFFFIMGYNFDMHGVAAAILERSKSGLVQNMWPVSPNTLIGHWENGELYYRCTTNGEDYARKDMLIINNTPTGYDTVLSPIQFAQDDLDLANKSKSLQREYYGGGSVIGNYIKVPDRAYETMKANIKAAFDSASGFRNIVLPDTVNVEPIKVGGEDISKLIAAQDWDAKEVARRFHVPPFLIGDIAGASVNAETQAMQFVTYCLQPRCKAWEIAFNQYVCSDDTYVKFELRGLMRGDHATRANWYKQMWDIGVYSINEIRELEDMEPLAGPGGNAHLILTNYGNIDDVANGVYKTSSPWDISMESHKDGHHRIEERKTRLSEAEYIREAEKPAKTARAKIEKLIRSEIEEALAFVKDAVTAGSPADLCCDIFMRSIEELNAKYGPQFTEVYTAVMEGLLPVIQMQSGKDGDPRTGDMEDFIKGYVEGLENRIKTKGRFQVEHAVTGENAEEELGTIARAIATSESATEVNRSSNAFAVFLMGQLGVLTMEVVCSSEACTFCQGLNGTIASVNGYIIKKGSSVTDSDGEPVKVDKNYRHPPFHEHCSCYVMPR